MYDNIILNCMALVDRVHSCFDCLVAEFLHVSLVACHECIEAPVDVSACMTGLGFLGCNTPLII